MAHMQNHKDTDTVNTAGTNTGKAKQLWTVWGKNVSPDRVLPDYPRMQLRRKCWHSLNGLWNYAFTPVSQRKIPTTWDGRILVPFSPETALSGVERQLQPEEYLWYRRTISADLLPHDRDSRVFLHFGAVDQSCVIYLDGKKIGQHRGGFLPFSVELTDSIFSQNPAGQRKEKFELTVRVRDLSDTSYHTRGKQKLKRGGMYYTAQSGIWQTVWLETVPKNFISSLQFRPNVGAIQISVTAETVLSSPEETAQEIEIEIFSPKVFLPDEEISCPLDEMPLASARGISGRELTVSLPDAKLWDCDEPWLYPVRVHMGEDTVESYFAQREISIRNDDRGIPRICLNGKEIYLKGILDQGYWPESLMTPPADEAILFDLTEMKKFGFNLVRKHAKIEPDRFYCHCDRLGLLVWQDIVNGGSPYKDWFVTYAATFLSWARIPISDRHAHLLSRENAHGREDFLREIKETAEALASHPSLIGWTVFNEGWGQFETKRCTDLLRSVDPDRLIDSSSGWFDQGDGDVRSVHFYFLTFRMRPEKKRAFILSEFGGLPRYVDGHSFGDKIYGYGKRYDSEAALTEAYRELTERMESYIPEGLTATVYTQWTDIEDEVNGLYTWDRAVRKLPYSQSPMT